jgi:hypothetical protein
MTAPLPGHTKFLDSEAIKRYRTQRNWNVWGEAQPNCEQVALPVMPDLALFTSRQRLMLELETAPKVTFVINPIYAVLIGRNEDNSLSQPAIDLAPYKAQQYGISRSHAVLRRYSDNLWLNDLGSRNGTFINQVKLQPFATYRLCDGDEVVFGSLKGRILFRDCDELSEGRWPHIGSQLLGRDEHLQSI